MTSKLAPVFQNKIMAADFLACVVSVEKGREAATPHIALFKSRTHRVERLIKRVQKVGRDGLRTCVGMKQG